MKQTYLDRANKELSQNYTQHKPITLDEIESVYSRDNVLGFNADAKTKKGSSKGYLTGILYFAPARLSGLEVCPGRSEGCTKACLFSAGRGRFYGVNRARVVKTLAFHFDTERFALVVKKSINKLIVKARNKGMIPAVRLNGTSDIMWESRTDIIQSFPDVQFYDYTKLAGRFSIPRPDNYHLTYSMSESNEAKALNVLKAGHNVAVVFSSIPAEFMGFKVLDGDKHDLRFLDRRGGFIVGLKAKGQAKKDQSGFVKNTLTNEKVA